MPGTAFRDASARAEVDGARMDAPPSRARGAVPATLVALAFFIVMLGTTLPTPLYPQYQRHDGFSQLLITVIFGVYAMSVMASLLLLGRLSDFVGRRPVLLAGVALSAASAALFTTDGGLTVFLVGRVLSGVSAALFTGSATAALVDLLPRAQHGRATAVAVAANLGGLGAGQLMSGVLADRVSRPLQVPYAADIGLCALAFLCLLAVRADEPRHEGTWRPQRFSVPQRVRPAFVPAAIAGFSGFSVFSLYGAIVPGFLVHEIRVSGATIVGIVTCALLVAAAVGQLATQRMPPSVALPVGCALLAAGAILTGVSIELTALVPLLIATATIGIGQGLVIGSGLARINELAPVEQRGETASNYFVVLYVGVALPAIAVGVVATAIGLHAATLLLTAAVTVTVAGVLATLTRQERGAA